MSKTLYVVIGCDTDPDRDYFLNDTPSDSLGWRGMLEGIPRAKEKLATLTDSDGHAPVFTWLLRVDHQVKEIHGAYNHVLAANHDFLLEVEKSGDELGWHPHFWCYDENKKAWRQNHEDTDWQLTMLAEAHAAFQEVLPGRPVSARMGWGYHNNRTMAALDKLGIKVELSGLPGLRILPAKNSGPLSNFFDWHNSPDHCYRPSAANYRRPASEGEPSLGLLVVPNLVSRSLLPGLVSGLVLAKKMKDIRQIGYALTRPAYMATITVKPVLFKPMLAQMKRSLKRHGNFIYLTPLHPDELIDNIHPAYSLEFMAENIRSILKLAERMERRVKFIKAQDILKFV